MRRVVPERLRLPPAAPPVDRQAALLLPLLPGADRLVRQCPGAELPGPEGAVPPLRRGDLDPLPAPRGDDGGTLRPAFPGPGRVERLRRAGVPRRGPARADPDRRAPPDPAERHHPARDRRGPPHQPSARHGRKRRRWRRRGLRSGGARVAAGRLLRCLARVRHPLGGERRLPPLAGAPRRPARAQGGRNRPRRLQAPGDDRGVPRRAPAPLLPVRRRRVGGRLRPADDPLRRLRLEVEAAVRRLPRIGGDPGDLRGRSARRLVYAPRRDRAVRGSLLRSYEGQIKIFLVLLVLFLAIAIYFDFHLLVVARNAVQEEVGRRMALEADLVRFELERDQMLRGLTASAGQPPYIPPTFLDRMARLKGMRAVEILSLDGRVISSSDPQRVGRDDALISGEDGGPRRSLLTGGSVVTPVAREAPRYATIAAYRPIQDRGRAAVAFIRVEEEVPILASVDLNLRTIASLQAGGLVFVLVLVILFAHWLLQPYRRLARAAGEAPGAIAADAAEPPDEPDYLVAAFQGVLDKLHEQEQQVLRLKQEREGPAGAPVLPGDRLIRGMTSAVLVFDGAGRLTVLNAAAEGLLGITRQAAVGRFHSDLLAPHARLLDLVGRSLASGESHSREVVPLVTPSGRVAHLGAMVSPMRSETGEGGGGTAVQGVVCLLADLTEIKALREVGGIEKVVDDFLRYARPGSLDLQEVDLRALIDGLVGELQDDPRVRGVRLEVEGSFPPIVGDETLIRQAVHNLVLNAAESFGGREGTAPGAAPAPDGRGGGARVVVRGSPADGPQGGARIEIEDNGPGIARQELARIFTPFYTTKERGTGLGLALVQKAAVLHDGRVEVESDEGRGARFTLVLPTRPGAT